MSKGYIVSRHQITEKNLGNIYGKPLVVISSAENKSSYTLEKYETKESLKIFLVLFYPSVSKILASGSSKTLNDPQFSLPIGILSASALSILTCNLI